MIPLAKLRSMNAESKPVGAAMDSQDVAAAMDAGTSAGVKKSWLKRERAKKEAAVDAADAAADKNRLGSVRKPLAALVPEDLPKVEQAAAHIRKALETYA